MSIRAPEVLILVVAVLSVGLFFVAPIVGLQRGVRRFASRTRSTSAVVLPALALAAMAILVLAGRFSLLFGSLSLALHGAWLWTSISANRHAARRAATSPPPPSTGSAHN